MNAKERGNGRLSRLLRRFFSAALVLWSLVVGAEIGHAQAPSKERMDAAEAYSVKMGGQTFIVVYDGQVIRESYANGGGADKVQLLASATKGLVGMAAAIAADEGIIDLDKPVVEVLTEWKNDPQKSKVTYRHLLTMASGFEELKDQTAWTDFLNAKVLFPAGSTFIYGPDPNIFGLALQRKLGAEKVEDYMKRKLFDPLGLRVEWRGRFADGNPQLSGGAYVRANEWYKYGEFVRRMIDGTWNGPKLLSKPLFDQVLASSQAYSAYGFYWWLKRPVSDSVGAIVDKNNSNQYTTQIKPLLRDTLVPNDFIMCRGAYGQCLYVMPSHKLVVVRNAPSTSRQLFQDDEFIDSLLLGSPNPNTPFVTITSTAVVKGSAGKPYTYAVSAQNNVGERITYALVSFPSGMHIDSSSGVITWPSPVTGTHAVSVRASMQSGGKQYSAVQSYTLVIEGEKPPLSIIFTTTPPLVGYEGRAYTYAVKAVASDTTKTVLLRLSPTAPTGMTLSSGTNILTWPSPIKGSYPITILARVQGDSLIERQTYTLEIRADTATSVMEYLPDLPLRIYPNPATEQISIESRSSCDDITEVAVSDVQGVLVRRITFPRGETRLTVDIRDLSSGAYTVRVNEGDSVIIQRVVINR